ncbi:hypothetical protein Thivi_0875 [Thiocystis violascens DSM 198]|uniref:Uncharacterized protein n=1 Tax=Thiocystis violascens (strain ATCC 17096 / DSM 198 / 6111) TaxID=765911 RepID=I3Y7E5_THIV6|nr:hypothetical protein Thivi_0875 [Thiocystis violascens DSM 198]
MPDFRLIDRDLPLELPFRFGGFSHDFPLTDLAAMH